ncbi:heterokaryon incompatibility protein-domain-containing protein [Rhexocercosporidium sp. MPI-PUGE-AT-0058]|nr:heterokaryon incompatibility protein-domain-containing protein [Rhexocercosporidium sp. MPI-PUGE-AT-0058]
MLCAVCYGVLRGHQGSQWRGTFDLHFDHQPDEVALRESAAKPVSCCICRSILGELSLVQKKGLKPQDNRINTLSGLYKFFERWMSAGLLRPNTINTKDRAAFISAYLSELPGLEEESNRVVDTFVPKIYRLDFKLRDAERVGTFVLEQLGDRSSSPLHTPFSRSTSSDEVLEVAKTWINRCTSEEHPDCPGEPSEGLQPWYPSRLIDLGSMVKIPGHKEIRDDPPQIAGDPERKRREDSKEDSEYIRLVTTKEERNMMQGFYVTLSHCWGGASFSKLTEDKMADFKRGVKLKELPKTFQNAIRFARRLGNKPGQVRYIWIDSLCIIQAAQPNKPTETEKSDWLKESAQMHLIYNNSYCNISATAATDSTKGLFLPREPHLLWEDEINLNTEGIPGISSDELIQRCKIIDLSFWERNIDDAPVNRRAWVLQERLMAPRVLHFCQDQIAWECRKVDASESFRDGIASFRLRAGEIERAERLKSFVPRILPGSQENTSSSGYLEGGLATYNHWKRIVERYSKTRLTNPGDKLIALSGIAKLMSGNLLNVAYVAGLWSEYLESQLLWRLDPVFEHGKFSFPSSRPPVYRSPSFSWAAIDAERGITYGEFTTDNLLISIERFEMFQDKGADKFGLVKEGCFIELLGVVKGIILEKRIDQSGTRYYWDLKGTPREPVGDSHKLEDEYSNVYLDSPQDDTDVLGQGGRMHCLPARHDANGYLICLLLQQDPRQGSQYRRVGLTKIPRYDQAGQKRVFDPDRPQDKPLSIRLV